MLKIRDNVDLKELEKFGFIKNENTYYYKNGFGIIVLLIFGNRKILTPRDYTGNMILHNLIQAGLVEKVEDK